MSLASTPSVARLLPLIALVGCSLSNTRAHEKLGRALEKEVSRNKNVHHAVLRVDAPALGIQDTWVAGEASSGTPMTDQTPFLSASIGKLFTAAAVFSLAEEGVLSLDDPITDWVEPDRLSGLPVVGGDGALDQLTLRLLLSHRSGLPDYYDTEVWPSRDGAPSIGELIVEEPEQSWDIDALLDYTRDHFDPYAAPGEAFLYSDVNYDLLGLAIEGATGEPFHAVVRERVMEPLGLTQTWYYNLEAPPEGSLPIADLWVGDVNLIGAPALSIDGAGGGLATTTGDLVTLMRGLLDGEPVSLEAMGTDWTRDSLTRGIDYGYSVWRIRPDGMSFLFGGLPSMRGVSGSTGSYLYVTADGAIISGTFDQAEYAEDHVRFMLSKVLPVLSRAEP